MNGRPLSSLCALVYSLVLFCGAVSQAQVRTGLVQSANPDNQALLVGVTYGLPGIDLDIANMKAIAENASYQLKPTTLWEAEGNVANTAQHLTDLSKASGKEGTFLFYFSGHGSSGSILLEDMEMQVKDIRTAIEAGRKGLTPLARLVLMFDSCYSGSLLDPFRRGISLDGILTPEMRTALLADNVVSEFTGTNRAKKKYWDNLFVFASSRADETSLASDAGSIFTLALVKGFTEVATANGTVGDFVAKTQAYTEGHHPVARLVPTTLEKEPLLLH